MAFQRDLYNRISDWGGGGGVLLEHPPPPLPPPHTDRVKKPLVNKYATDKRKNLYACFVDFKKAFDSTGCLKQNTVF